MAVVDRAREPAVPGAVKSCRVLLIEDNSDSRFTLRILFELWGHQVEVANDGLDGVRKALDWKPQAAVIDIGLPGLNGYEVAERIRGVLGTQILLIALSGYGRPEDRARALQAGFDIHMVKPADFERLGQLLAERAEQGS